MASYSGEIELTVYGGDDDDGGDGDDDDGGDADDKLCD